MYECIRKMWYKNTMEYYSALKEKEILLSVMTWVDLEDMMLSELNQTKTNPAWYHLYVKSKKNDEQRK